jgi:hypothetical protein
MFRGSLARATCLVMGKRRRRTHPRKTKRGTYIRYRQQQICISESKKLPGKEQMKRTERLSENAHYYVDSTNYSFLPTADCIK